MIDLHAHDHPSEHSARRAGERKRLILAMSMTGLILIVEVLGGLLTNSLALVSDGGHMLSDLLSLGMALFAFTLASRPPTDRRTYGFHRFEILAALANGLLLIGVAVYILIQAFGRFFDPQPVDSLPMLAIAGIGLVANLVSIRVLKGHAHSLNTRGALLHVISDTLSSVGVMVGGVVIALTGWFVVDALISVGIAAVILTSAFRLSREAVSILLESTPKNIPLPDVQQAISAISGVEGVHDLHLWTITSGLYALSAHVMVGDHACYSEGGTLTSVNEVLRQRFAITHTTLQIECARCCPDDHCVLARV